MSRKCLFTCIIFLLIYLTGCTLPQSDLVLEGIVETSIYSHPCEVSGKITRLSVKLGQQVKAGDEIAVIDNSNEQYALEQLKAALAKKQANLEDLINAVDPAEVKQAENNIAIARTAYDTAQLTYEHTLKTYEKKRILYEAGGISESVLEDAKYQLDLAAAQVSTALTQLDNANQKLALLNKNPDPEKIAFTEADIEQTKSQIRQAEANLAKYRITALRDGTVISLNYLQNDIVAPGYNLCDIASNTDKYLVAYLPQEYLNDINYGQKVQIRSGKNKYTGTIAYIDARAQYTPKEFQTAANKNKNTIKIKAELSEDNPLKIGERAELVLDKM
jgi:HlyD family secretion protein